MSNPLTRRPVHRNIHVSQIVGYRLLAAGVVSILHRVSGALLFLSMPLIVWLFDRSVTSDASFAVLARAFGAGLGAVPGSAHLRVQWLKSLLPAVMPALEQSPCGRNGG